MISTRMKQLICAGDTEFSFELKIRVYTEGQNGWTVL